jgi:hypothetical protein
VYNLIFSVCLCRALGYPQKDLENCYESIEPELLKAIKEHELKEADTLYCFILLFHKHKRGKRECLLGGCQSDIRFISSLHLYLISDI